jgi:ATP-dependent Clp protease, protease subunit
VSVEQVEKDIDRDRFMTAEDAKAYGIIDDILSSRTEIGGTDGALTKGDKPAITGIEPESSPAEKTD